MRSGTIRSGRHGVRSSRAAASTPTQGFRSISAGRTSAKSWDVVILKQNLDGASHAGATPDKAATLPLSWMAGARTYQSRMMPFGGPAVDLCVVNTTALKSCQQMACHGGAPVSAGLDLGTVSVTTNAKSFLDKANVGTMGVTMPGDPIGCEPGKYKLIDSANPMNSLLYTKVGTPSDPSIPPCGTKMPVIGTFTAADKQCILDWINSVIALP